MGLPGQQSVERAQVMQMRPEILYFVNADQALHVTEIYASCVQLVSSKHSDETFTHSSHAELFAVYSITVRGEKQFGAMPA